MCIRDRHLALLETSGGEAPAPVLAAARRKLFEGAPAELSAQEKTAVLLDADTLVEARGRYADA